MNTIEAMKTSLAALNKVLMSSDGGESVKYAKQELRQAIAQMEKVEPYGHFIEHIGAAMQINADSIGLDGVASFPLYSHPSSLRELTDEDIEEIWHTELDNRQLSSIRAILAKARCE